jgi:hypothetical protein
MKIELSLVTIGKKFDQPDSDFCENLLWHINHCNVPLTDDYLYKAGIVKLEKGEDVIFSFVVDYKDCVVMYREYLRPKVYYEKQKEHVEKEIKQMVYYEIMNNLLLWTGADSVKKMIEEHRKEFTYLPLKSKHSICLEMVNEELLKTRKKITYDN